MVPVLNFTGEFIVFRLNAHVGALDGGASGKAIPHFHRAQRRIQ
jgi:hypothetical protein